MYGLNLRLRGALACLVLLLPRLTAAATRRNREARLQMTNVIHHPCWQSAVNDNDEQLQSVPAGIKLAMLNSDSTAPLIPVKRKPGCYYLDSTIMVVGDEPIDSSLQVYVELRFSLTEAALQDGPERCRNFDEKTGCGGFGSCIYCDRCEELEEKAEQRENQIVFELHRDGEPLHCDDRLQPGKHENVQLHFCMPTERQFFEILKDHDITSTTAKDWLEHRGGTQYAGSVHMNIYLYDTNVAPALISQRNIERLLTREHTEPLPIRAYQNMPFTKYVYRQLELQGANKASELPPSDYNFMGCHKFSGTLLVNIDRDDERFLDNRREDKNS